ncbi:hypothetical protein AOLI_G00053870 [Acnodon oligacanthus]
MGTTLKTVWRDSRVTRLEAGVGARMLDGKINTVARGRLTFEGDVYQVIRYWLVLALVLAPTSSGGMAM